MPQSGMERLLSVVGIDPNEIRASIETFMQTMKDTAAKVNANQERIEEKLDKIIAGQAIAAAVQTPTSTVTVLENGQHTGVLITDEKFPDAMLQDVGMTFAGDRGHD